MHTIIDTGDQLVAVGGNPFDTGLMAAWASPDGINWRRLPSPDEIIDPNVAYMEAVAITYIDGAIYAAGRDYDARRSDGLQERAALWVSSDGATWERITLEELPGLIPFTIVNLDDSLIGFWPPLTWPGRPARFRRQLGSWPPPHLRDEEHTWAPTPYRLEGDHLTWGPLWRFRGFAVAPRVYLHELRRLDLKDGAQLLDFCNQFGALWIQPDPGTSLRLDEVRYAAALIRTLTSIYHLHETGQFNNESIQKWKWDAEWVAPPPDAITGHEYFTNEMNRLLNAVTPMVGFGNHQQRPNTLRDVLAIQLFNDIAGGVTYKTCASDSCGELFVNQINRKVNGRSRSNGTLYCSPRCSKAQAQRKYRQRNNGHGA